MLNPEGAYISPSGIQKQQSDSQLMSGRTVFPAAAASRFGATFARRIASHLLKNDSGFTEFGVQSDQYFFKKHTYMKNLSGTTCRLLTRRLSV